MSLVQTVAPVLDGGLVDIGDGTPRRRALRIAAGEYPTPLWARTESGLVVRVDDLPWQAGLDIGELEILSADPNAGGQPALAFAIDWGTGTGNGLSAITDGGKVDVASGSAGPSSLIDVVETDVELVGAPAGWPANLLRQRSDSELNTIVGLDNRGSAHPSAWAAPAIGESIWYRMLFYNGLPDAPPGVTFEHGNQSNIGALEHYWQVFSGNQGSAGAGEAEFGFGHGSGSQASNFFIIPVGRFYRLEWQVTRLTASTMSVLIRIYDEATSLTVPEYTEVDCLENFGSGPGHVGQQTWTYADVDLAFRGYLFGVSGSSSVVQGYWYVSGFAVSLEGWIGQYVPGESA